MERSSDPIHREPATGTPRVEANRIRFCDAAVPTANEHLSGRSWRRLVAVLAVAGALLPAGVKGESVPAAAPNHNCAAAARPARPVIQLFQAESTTVTIGESARLTWVVDGATALSVFPKPGEVTGSSVSVTPATTTTYELVASNAGGSTVKTVTIRVTPPLPMIASEMATPGGHDLHARKPATGGVARDCRRPVRKFSA